MINNTIINICTANVQSLNKDKLEHIELDLARDFDIICLNETNLHPNRKIDFSLKIDGFQEIIRKDRTDRQWGGVAAYVSDHIAAIRRTDLEINGIEAMWLELRCVNKKMLLCVCYRDPNSLVIFWDHFSDSIELAKESNINDIIITGDLNADPIGNYRNFSKLKQLCESNNFQIHITEPTRVTQATATCLDQFISNLYDKVKSVHVTHPIGDSDHNKIEMKINLNISLNKCYDRLIWDYSKANFDQFRNALSSADWDSCFVDDDIEQSCNNWTTTFLQISRENIPNKIVTIRTKDKPFYNSELRRLKRKRDRLRKEAHRLKTESAWDRYRQARNIYNRSIVEEKENYDVKLQSFLKESDNRSTKKWWHIAKSFPAAE